uniref:Uncharacterized protein n=1 Tax=Dendroctonus ponderosae TaxID=77166 RepID=A0AAR5PTC2_DENPD
MSTLRRSKRTKKDIKTCVCGCRVGFPTIEVPTAIRTGCPIRSTLEITSSSIDKTPFNIPKEPNAAIDSVQIKRKCVDEVADGKVSRRQCVVDTHCPDKILQIQPCELINERCSPENRIFEAEIKVEEENDLKDPPSDINDEAQLDDDLDSTVEFSNEVTGGIVNNLHGCEQENAVTNNSPAVISTAVVSDNGKSDFSLQNLENTIFQVLASDRKGNCTEIEKMVDKMKLIDDCIQHLSNYRRYLLQSLLPLSKRNHSTPHNYCVASQIHSQGSPSNSPVPIFTLPTATKRTRLIDADQGIIIKRKATGVSFNLA